MLQKLTMRTVAATRPAAKDLFLWDGETRGLGLKVTPAGAKIYILQYRLNGGASRRFTIGRHGSPWTPETARAKAIALLGDIARGLDPAEEKRKAREDITVSELCELYLEEAVRTKKASTIAMDRSRIERHVKPLLGRKRVKQLTKPDIERFMLDVADGKTACDEKTRKFGRAIVRGGKGIANRTLGMLGAILQFAVERSVRDDNPARNVRKFKEGRRGRFLTGPEIERLGAALVRAEAAGANPRAIAALRLLALTGCRKSEILKLRWDEIDLEGGFLRLHDSKTGTKTVPLPSPAMTVLAGIRSIAGNPHVIAGENVDSHLVNLQKTWRKIRVDAGLGDVRLHDLRHSFASVGARSGESLLVIGKVLGHATTAATSRYAHLADDPVRSASEKISSEIEAKLGLGSSSRSTTLR